MCNAAALDEAVDTLDSYMSKASICRCGETYHMGQAYATTAVDWIVVLRHLRCIPGLQIQPCQSLCTRKTLVAAHVPVMGYIRF